MCRVMRPCGRLSEVCVKMCDEKEISFFHGSQFLRNGFPVIDCIHLDYICLLNSSEPIKRSSSVESVCIDLFPSCALLTKSDKVGLPSGNRAVHGPLFFVPFFPNEHCKHCYIVSDRHIMR